MDTGGNIANGESGMAMQREKRKKETNNAVDDEKMGFEKCR